MDENLKDDGTRCDRNGISFRSLFSLIFEDSFLLSRWIFLVLKKETIECDLMKINIAE